jgi:hypothetical protein
MDKRILYVGKVGKLLLLIFETMNASFSNKLFFDKCVEKAIYLYLHTNF